MQHISVCLLASICNVPFSQDAEHLANNGTHCAQLECSHSLQHQRLVARICMQICLCVLCERGLRTSPKGTTWQLAGRINEQFWFVCRVLLVPGGWRGGGAFRCLFQLRVLSNLEITVHVCGPLAFCGPKSRQTRARHWQAF